MAVARFEIERRLPFAEGKEFGIVGAYEQLIGRLVYSVDPGSPVNRPIVDLDLAPRGSDGRVAFAGDVSLVVPKEPRRGNGTLIVDVPNRDRPLLSGVLNAAGAKALEQPFHPGDGLIFRQGFSMATVGWQFDVVRAPDAYYLEPPILHGLCGKLLARLVPDTSGETMPLSQLGSIPYPPAEPNASSDRLILHDERGDGWTEIERSRWQLLTPKETDGTPFAVVAKIEGGFEPGRIYSVVYEAKDPPLAGAAMLALRDAASFFRGGGCEAAPDGFENVLAVGVSQTGRLLRHLLSQGLNLDEAGKQVYDGLFVMIAGAARGQFNHRFAQPSATSTSSVGAGFPFSDANTPDPYGERKGGVFDAALENGSMPKVVVANTALEYWRGDASLGHTMADGSEDVEHGPDVRSYMFAGTQHGSGSLPQVRTNPATGTKAHYGFNVIDYRPGMRAAFMNLADWVRHGTEPPASAVPRIDDGSAVTRESVLKRFEDAGWRTLDPEKLERMRSADLGPDEDRGIGVYPPVLGPAYEGLVPRIDEDFNDDAGIRLPDITVPVGTHAGWNPRFAESGSGGRAARLVGLTRFFVRSEADRESGDSRRGLLARYAGRDDYLKRVRAEAEILAANRYLLEEDVDWVVSNCGRRYDAALETGTERPD